MTDKDLLELAAKAAEIRIEYWTEDSSGDVPVAVISNGDFWQPLLLNTHTDCMGDALRLAVKLKIECRFLMDCVVSGLEFRKNSSTLIQEFYEDYKGDVNAATRRAIVRAAAEIGRASGSDGEAG